MCRTRPCCHSNVSDVNTVRKLQLTSHSTGGMQIRLHTGLCCREQAQGQHCCAQRAQHRHAQRASCCKDSERNTALHHHQCKAQKHNSRHHMLGAAALWRQQCAYAQVHFQCWSVPVIVTGLLIKDHMPTSGTTGSDARRQTCKMQGVDCSAVASCLTTFPAKMQLRSVRAEWKYPLLENGPLVRLRATLHQQHRRSLMKANQRTQFSS